MATNVIKTPILRAVQTRSYARAAPISGQICEIRTTTLPNKIVVSSAENGSPIARLSIIFRAGSRYENALNQGSAHVLRIAAGLSTRNNTQFAITRNIQQAGASLTCTTDRETIAYTLEGTYEAVERTSEFLSDIACAQAFKPWEVSDASPRLRLELASLSPQVRVINFLHRAAFRTGLGNSLFCAKHNVGRVSSETLQDYIARNYTNDRCAVVGIGVSHDSLVNYAKNLCLPDGKGSDSASQYYGGEIRSEKGGDLAYVALGAQGGALSNPQEALAFAVLQRAYGVGPYAKRGVENCGILSKAVGGNSVAVSALNVSYSDNGLFGAVLAGPADSICEAVSAAAQVLRSGNVSDQDVCRAKNQLKTAILLNSESGRDYIDNIGPQAVTTGCIQTPDQIISAVDSISPSDVKDAARKVASSRLSIASVGNVSQVPFLDQLK